MTPYAQPSAPNPYAPTPYGAQTYNTPPPVPGIYGGARPVGKQRSVAAVIIFTLITLTIYSYVWAWKISKEMDRFTGETKHKILRTGVLLAVFGFAAAIVGIVVIFSSAGFDPATETFGPEEEISAAIIPGALLALAGAVLILVGVILMMVGMYRLFSNLEKDDKMRGEAQPTNATLLLVLLILGYVVPYIGFVLTLVTYGMTQSALNRTWKVYGMAPPPQAYAGSAPV